MLTLAARHADIVNVQPALRSGPQGRPDSSAYTLEAMDRQIARLRELAGERFSSLELSTQIRDLTITSSPVWGTSTTDDEPPRLSAVADTVEQICERLYANRERFGFSYIVVMVNNMEAFAPEIVLTQKGLHILFACGACQG